MSLPARIGAYFLEPAEPAPGVPPGASGGQVAPSPPGLPRAAVLGVPAAVVPLAAACAGELRARERSAASLICLWRPGQAASLAESDAPAARSPAGATTPGARRLAARLGAEDLAPTACGRLAWIALDSEPIVAAEQVRRCVEVASAPLVLAVAGPRPAAFEPLIAGFDLAIAVLAADADPALRELALTTLPAPSGLVLPPLPPGPPRWAAMAGLARLRALPEACG